MFLAISCLCSFQAGLFTPLLDLCIFTPGLEVAGVRHAESDDYLVQEDRWEQGRMVWGNWLAQDVRRGGAIMSFVSDFVGCSSAAR